MGLDRDPSHCGHGIRPGGGTVTSQVGAKDRFFPLYFPLIGPWLRDVAILQVAKAISAMVECGDKPVDAVEIATDCVRNREVRSAVEDARRRVE